MIAVLGWEKFQHYKDQTAPPWVKLYTDLLRKDEFMDLSTHRRAVLQGIWLLYAEKRRRVRHDTAMLSRELNARVTSPDLEALAAAGFIEICSRERLEELHSVPTLEVEVEREGVKREESRNGHNPSGDPLVRCQICGLPFRGPKGLERHLRNVHDEVPA